MENPYEHTGPDRLLAQRLTRRRVLRSAVTMGAVLTGASLVAACGGDDEATPTQAATEPTATPAGTDTEPTATVDAADPTPTATVDQAESTPTTAGADPTPTTAAGTNPRWMGREIEPAEHTGGTLIEATLGAFEYPWLVQGNNWWGIMESLVEVHPETLEPVDALAVAWESSEDGLTWRFTIREGVRFHDGTTMTVDDVTASYRVFELAYRFYGEREWEGRTLDERTFELSIDRMTSNFFYLNANDFTVMKQSIVDQYPDEEYSEDGIWFLPIATGSDPSQVIGTGPFKFQEFVPGERLTMVRNEDYWDGDVHLDQVIVQAVSDVTVAVTQMTTGALDLIGPAGDVIDPASAIQLESAADLDLISFQSSNAYWYFTNVREDRSALFQDVAVRQAMLLAVDREAIVEATVFGRGSVAHSVMPPAQGFDESRVVPRYDYDPDEANRLLDEAGWEPGPDGVRARDGIPFAFTIMTDGDPIIDAIAAILQEAWRAVGLQTQIETLSSAVFWERLADTFDYDIAIARQRPSLWSFWTWQCENPDNRTGYCNPELDELYARANEELDEEAWMDLLVQINDMLMTDLPIAPLLWTEGIGARNQRVHNVYLADRNRRFNMETWWVEPA